MNILKRFREVLKNNNGFSLTEFIMVLVATLALGGTIVGLNILANTLVKANNLKEDAQIVANYEMTSGKSNSLYLDVFKVGTTTNIEAILPPSSTTKEVSLSRVTDNLYLKLNNNIMSLVKDVSGTAFTSSDVFKYFLNGDKSRVVSNSNSSDASIAVESLSYRGANGLCSIIPDGETDVEKAVFESMLNLEDLIIDETEIINFVDETGASIDQSSYDQTVEKYEEMRIEYLKRILGDVSEYNSKTDNRIIRLVQVDLAKMEEDNKFSVLSSKKADYIVYIVDNIASKSESVKLLTDTTDTTLQGNALTTDDEFAKTIYSKIKENLQVGSVVIIPQKNGNIVKVDGKAFLVSN